MCAATIQQDVARKLAEVKEALIYIRCSKDPEVQGSFCDVATETVTKLAAYEERRLAEISPSPAALLVMLQGKKQEATSALAGKPEVVRPLAGGTAYLSHISAPAREAPESGAAAPHRAAPEADALGGRICVTAPRGERDWWAWEPSTPQPEATRALRRQGVADARGKDRLPVDCLALLDPGAIRGTLQNISPGGVFLQTDKLHVPGQSVRLIVSTAHGPAKAQGVVRWVRADTLSGAEAGMGIEFTEIAEELQSYLSARLGYSLPVAAPQASTAAARPSA
ncbi:MAG: PilZ domain-containing protein [Deferrisomatales bacterium]|nr:PilZ domain-containing protein [Deferrisomatales bacterium]